MKIVKAGEKGKQKEKEEQKRIHSACSTFKCVRSGSVFTSEHELAITAQHYDVSYCYRGT